MAVIRTSNVDLKVNGDGAYAYVAQPDDNAKHPGVVLIQEWWGIEPHIRDLAHKVAAEGFVVAVPDLFHGKVVTEPDEAQKMVMMIAGNIDKAVREIIGALETVKAMPNVEPKKLGLMGFCVGGMLTLVVASRYPDLGAVVAFYPGGYDPKPEDVAKINAPVLGLYGQIDARIVETVEPTVAAMKKLGKTYERHIYKDATHAFLEYQNLGANGEATADAWPRAITFLKEHTK